MSRDDTTTLLDTGLEGTDQPSPAAAVLLALDRLLTAGALYPPGHARFEAAVQEYRRSATEACGPFRLQVEMEDDALRIQDVALDASHRGQERLLTLFEWLGIQRILIDADTPADALHHLATGLLRQRREADEAGHLKEVVFDDLPVQVSIVARTFRKRWSDEIDDRFIPPIEAIMEDAAAMCADAEPARVARETLEKMFTAFLAQGREDGKADTCAPGDRKEIENLLLRTPTRLADAVRGIIRRDGSLASIDRLFDDSHEALTHAAARDALRLLVTAMQGPDEVRGAEDPGVEDRRVDDDRAYGMTIEQLGRSFTEVEEICDSSLPDVGDVREEISVCLSLLGLGTTEDIARQALAGLRSAIGRVRTGEERDFLRETARNLASTADLEILDEVLPRLADPFRTLGSDAVAGYWQFLVDRDEERLARAWPHLVIDLLRTKPEAGRQGLSVMQSLATDLPTERMLAEASRFAHLPSFRLASFDKHVFFRPDPVLHPMFAALLCTPEGENFGHWLQEGFMRTDEDTAGGLLARVLGTYGDSHCDIYKAVLMNNPDDEDGAPPRVLLGQVKQRVERLGPEERLLDWVPVAILVLGSWHLEASEGLLDRIAHERQWLVRHTWPKPCRRAATHALTLHGSSHRKAGRS